MSQSNTCDRIGQLKITEQMFRLYIVFSPRKIYTVSIKKNEKTVSLGDSADQSEAFMK